MAKILHRTFEIYESQEEAIAALTPKSAKPEIAFEEADVGPLECLSVSRSAGVTHVQFSRATNFDEATVAGLREEFARLATKLGKDSKILVDFTGVESFHAAFVDALLVFSRKLRIKGSRIALCCLAPSAREFFFVPDDRDRRNPPL